MNFKLKWPLTVKLAGIFVVYFATASLGLRLGAVEGFATLIWPPAGIALASVLLFGFRVWPSIFLAAAVANFINGAPVAVAFGLGAGNTLEALFGAFLLQTFVGFSNRLNRLRDVLGLVVLSASLSSVISASIGVTTLYLGGIVSNETFWTAWQAWWVGDAVGVLIVAPVILVWAKRQWPKFTALCLLEATGILLGLAVTTFIIFGHIEFLPWPHPPVTYATIPFVIWAGLRFGMFGAVNASFLLCAFSVWSTVAGYGPFASSSLTYSLSYLAIFQSVVAISGMILAAVMMERKQAMAELYKNQEELERRVLIRTSELRKTEDRFRTLIYGAKDYAIFMLDTHGIVTTWNEGAKRIKGYEASEMVGQHFSRFFTPEDVQAGRPDRLLGEAIAYGRTEDEGLRRRKDGTNFWANVVLTAIRENGELVGFSKITRDLTERKRADDELKRAHALLEKRVEERTEELRQALQTRDEFLSIASHELKTPLTSMLLQLQLLGKYIDQLSTAKSAEVSSLLTPEKLIRSVHICEKQGRKLADLLDELLDLTRIRAGKLSLSIERISLSSVVFEAVERHKEAAKKAGSPITVKADTSLVGSWDRMRLEQIMTNLLSNAIKYGGGNPIEVFLEEDSQRKAALVKVVDQGIGIPQNLQEKIFEPYERVMTEEGKGISGLGLGLYITRQIVEAHQGTIEFQSNNGGGSKFTVMLPFERREDLEAEVPAV